MVSQVNPKLAALFQRFSRQLGALDPALRGLFRCPFCLSSFSKDDMKLGKLSLEHIVPEGLGGRETTLTCEDCNNTHGSKIDKHWSGRADHEEIMAGEGPGALDGNIVSQDGHITVALTKDDAGDGRFTASIQPKRSNPRAVQSFVKKREDPRTVTLQYRMGFVPRLSELSVARSAYLVMFHHYGYQYACRGTADGLREQIQRPGSEIVQPPVFELPHDEFPDDMVNIGHLVSPQELRGFVVKLKPPRGPGPPLGVALAGPDEDDTEYFRRWETLRGRTPEIESYFMPRAEMHDFDQPEFDQYLRLVWREAGLW